MKEFREGELLNILNKQYSGMHLKEPRKVEKNSVVLLRNIANESKREPMKFARVLKVNESKDNAQRILTLAYNNIKKRKDGNWTGIPITVERSINDVIPIDIALNKSMLSPSMLEKGKHIDIDENVDETDENALIDINKNTNESDETALDGITINERIDEDTLGDKKGSKSNDEDENIDEERNDDEKKDTDEQYTEKEVTRKAEGGNKQARRSERIKKQRVEIHPDDIGENDDENDKNYK